MIKSSDKVEAVAGTREDPHPFLRPRECIECPGRRIWWNGWRVRTASVLVEETVVYLPKVVCRRVKCADCRKSWTVRPPGLLPHKHFQPCVAARALEAYLFDETASQASVAGASQTSPRTLRRWIAWTAGLASPEDCQRWLLRVTGAPLLPEMVLVPPARLEACSRTREVLSRAAKVLCLLESLVCGWGVEPPGLRGVLERVIRGRSGWCTYARPILPEPAW